MLILLAHISLDVLDRAAAHAFYVVGLGGVEDPSCSTDELVVNAGASQLRMRSGPVAQQWQGHIELWTRESLTVVRARLLQQCQTVIAPLLESQQRPPIDAPELLDDLHGQRLLCSCPHGNTLLVRRVPASYYIYSHGSHPGGIGGLVAVTRLVHLVNLGTAAALHAFWSRMLGASRCELVQRAPVGDGPPTAHAMVRFSSGQQIIFDEREPPAEGADAAAGRGGGGGNSGGGLRGTAHPLAADAHDVDARAAYHLCVYVDSVDAFRAAFDACERARLVWANPALAAQPAAQGNAVTWAEAEAAGQFRVKDMLQTLPGGDGNGDGGGDGDGDGGGDGDGEADRRVALVLEVAVRSVAHKECPLPRADIVAGGVHLEPPAAFAGCSPLPPPPHAKPGLIRIPHGRGGFGEAAREIARARRARAQAQPTAAR